MEARDICWRASRVQRGKIQRRGSKQRPRVEARPRKEGGPQRRERERERETGANPEYADNPPKSATPWARAHLRCCAKRALREEKDSSPKDQDGPLRAEEKTEVPE